MQGRRVILAGTNNYLGLSFDPRCIAAAQEAVAKWGTGTTGSRMANGSFSEHQALEREMAELRSELRVEMADLRAELRGEMSELRTELGGEMAELRAEVHVEIARLESTITEFTTEIKTHTTRAIVGGVAVNVVAVLGAVGLT